MVSNGGIYNRLVFLILFIVYYFQANVAQMLGLQNKILNYLMLLLSLIPIFCFHLSYRKYKEEYIILLTSIGFLIFRYVMGMFEETIQTLMNLLFPALFFLIINASVLNDIKIQKKIEKFVTTFFIVNSLIAILEFITKVHFIGWHETAYADGMQVVYDSKEFRSVALAGGPLSNAEITTLFNLFVLFSPMPNKKKYSLYFLGLLAIMCFNSRVAILINILGYILFLLKCFKSYSIKTNLNLFFIFIIGGIIVFYLLNNTNMGSRLINTTSEDGSIAVRLRLFEGIGQLNLYDFLWGSTLSNVRLLMEEMEILVIENFWICYILHFGIVPLIIFTYLYYLLIRKVMKSYSIYEKIVISICFIVLSSSNNSLYSSYVSLFTFLLLAYIFSFHYLSNLKR